MRQFIVGIAALMLVAATAQSASAQLGRSKLGADGVKCPNGSVARSLAECKPSGQTATTTQTPKKKK